MKQDSNLAKATHFAKGFLLTKRSRVSRSPLLDPLTATPPGVLWSHCNLYRHTVPGACTLQYMRWHSSQSSRATLSVVLCLSYTRPILNLESPTLRCSWPYTCILISRDFLN